jgi:uncharacterized NAD(P)/FAD-binding protein YdhS
VAIVGAGASGALAAVHLLRAVGDGRVEIDLFDRGGRFGPGVAYAAEDPMHLLNVPAVRMGAISGQPDHFHRWLEHRGEGLGEGGFATRATFGRYLEELLDQAEREAPGSRLRRRSGEVVAVRELGPAPAGELDLALADGERLVVDWVVLALGLPAATDPVPVAPRLRESGVYIPDPWAEGALEGARNDSSVVILGTGLTMVDVALSLGAAESGPAVRAVSRHGLVPRRHRRSLTRVEPFDLPRDGGLDSVFAAAEAQIERVAAQGGDWRDVIDSMRTASPGLWRSLRLEEKRRFLFEINRYWDVHRFRMAPDVADRLERLAQEGRVRWGAQPIEAIEPLGDRARVVLRGADGDRPESLEVDRVINCTGAGVDIAADAPPLLAGLFAAGRARPDPLGLGLDVEESGAVLDASGNADPRLSVVGALRKGVEWEAIGVTEIRDHAAAIARHVIDRPAS